LHPEDSRATLLYGWPDASAAEWEATKETITNAIQARCHAEGGRLPCTADMLTGLQAVWAPAKEGRSRKREATTTTTTLTPLIRSRVSQSWKHRRKRRVQAD
jgi:hypothetical protein